MYVCITNKGTSNGLHGKSAAYLTINYYHIIISIFYYLSVFKVHSLQSTNSSINGLFALKY